MRVAKRTEALARAIHKHQLCCMLEFDWCPYRRDGLLEAKDIIAELERLGYRLVVKR